MGIIYNITSESLCEKQNLFSVSASVKGVCLVKVLYFALDLLCLFVCCCCFCFLVFLFFLVFGVIEGIFHKIARITFVFFIQFLRDQSKIPLTAPS